MPHINLLPWREAQRQQQKKNYLTLLVGIGVSMVLLMFAVSKGMDQVIATQEQRNQFLTQEMAKIDTQIGEIKNIKQSKEAIEQRMTLIEQLEVSRNAAPIVLDELARIVPSGVSFSRFSRTINRVEIDGVSDSNNRLANFMRNLAESNVFNDAELSSIVADTSAADAVSEFKIKFNISPSVAPDFNQHQGEPK
ncbi:PilN domain-containing protein [Paraglaciecola chathamensis]|uniref:PilN domain-containing protein n=1 Tax=Paraglaciecola chathamensis TaxID=368405 RepID=A0ABS0W8P7_9ALTE|nr:PilN domain-containing protein [Paraglaciecola chathamensis]